MNIGCYIHSANANECCHCMKRYCALKFKLKSFDQMQFDARLWSTDFHWMVEEEENGWIFSINPPIWTSVGLRQSEISLDLLKSSVTDCEWEGMECLDTHWGQIPDLGHVEIGEKTVDCALRLSSLGLSPPTFAWMMPSTQTLFCFVTEMDQYLDLFSHQLNAPCTNAQERR